jgi:transcriptional regulator with XRE-family HTH domain
LEEENLVKKTCKELGITQKELAERIGLTDRTLSRYATEKIPLHIEKHLLLMIKDKNNSESMKNLKNSINTLHSLINDK